MKYEMLRRWKVVISVGENDYSRRIIITCNVYTYNFCCDFQCIFHSTTRTFVADLQLLHKCIRQKEKIAREIAAEVASVIRPWRTCNLISCDFPGKISTSPCSNWCILLFPSRWHNWCSSCRRSDSCRCWCAGIVVGTKINEHYEIWNINMK